jgi:hypothetical protein
MTANDPPLIAGVIHGVRVWSIVWDGEGHLGGSVQGSRWEPGGEATRARCLTVAHGDHSPPEPNCGCGLYAIHPRVAGPNDLPGLGIGGSSLHAVAGIVEAWGRVEVYGRGFRAEYARPLALAAIGVPLGSPRERQIRELAERYGASLLRFARPQDLLGYCRRRGLGLDPAVIASLVPATPRPDRWSAPQPPTSRLLPRSRPPTGLRRCGQLVGTGLLVLLAIAWYAIWVIAGVFLLIGVVRAIIEEPRPEFSPRHVRVLDERLVRFGGTLSYIAIVRNTSDDKVALAAFPRGKVVGADGEEVVSIQQRERIDLRPSLGPGETGVVIDRLGRSRDVDVDRRLRYETEILARRRAAPDGYRAPLTFSRAELVRAPCGVTARVDARTDVRRASIALVLFDRAGRIVSAGWTHAGPFEEGRSRERIAGSGKPCPSQFASVAASPNPTPDELMGEGP